MLPQFGKIDMTWLVSASILPMLISWSVLFLEAMYPLGMIWKRSRPFFLVGIIGMHLSIAFSMGLWSFSLMMVALNVSLFGADYIDSAVNVAKNFRLKGKSMFSSRLQIGLDQKQTKLGWFLNFGWNTITQILFFLMAFAIFAIPGWIGSSNEMQTTSCTLRRYRAWQLAHWSQIQPRV